MTKDLRLGMQRHSRAKDAPTMPKLLLTAREAAGTMSVCEKTLWNITEPRGDLPAVRIGRRVLYDLTDLRRWIDKRKTTNFCE